MDWGVITQRDHLRKALMGCSVDVYELVAKDRYADDWDAVVNGFSSRQKTAVGDEKYAIWMC